MAFWKLLWLEKETILCTCDVTSVEYDDVVIDNSLFTFEKDLIEPQYIGSTKSLSKVNEPALWKEYAKYVW